jgi:hypothetical protein
VIELLALLLGAAALAIGITALYLVWRDGRVSSSDPVAGARTADLDRRVAQLGQRLEVLEGDVDAQRGGEVIDARPAASVIRRTGAAISHIGLVRFDAFDDTGGGQSFALALIDDDGDGIILTSLHSRQATRLYVKDIRGGVADAPLSGEEEQALREAGLMP